MLYKTNAKSLLATVAVISWSLLLANVLLAAESLRQQKAIIGAFPFITNLLVIVFVVSVFLFQRLNTETLKGMDFMGYLMNLFSRGAVAAYVALPLHLGYKMVTEYNQLQSPLLLHLVYQINFGLLVIFLARAFYTWRQLLLYHKNKFLQIAWDWFELLLAATFLLTLFNFDYTNYIFLPLLALMCFYTLFLCTNLKWVAYLTFNNKSRSLLLLGAILVSCYVFLRYFYNSANSPELVVDYTDVGTLLLAMLFVGLYSLSAFLVSLFSLPTSSVFEQKSADLLNFQRLSQSIQQGQSEAQVYDMLFDSTIKASDASAAWYEHIRNSEPVVSHLLNVNEDQIKRIRHLLLAYNIHNIDYINNNLDRNPGFRDLMLPWKSLIILPIKTKKHLSGVLYLLKDIEQGFDRETVNVLRTFTSQTMLTIENLRLINESLQNERYKEELKIASQVQESLIPKNFPTDSWFEISTHAVAAKEVGGDFYDFLQLSESRIAIIIGDVSGKGISAAFHMAQMKGIFHGLMQQDMPPSEFMKQANSALSRCLEKTSFITSALYIIDYRMKGFMFARAGHCHTLYYNAMMDDVFYFQTEGLGLGIIRDKSYSNHVREMYYDYNPGDVMVIYTDGIVEARNEANEEYGENRLLYMLQQTYHLEAEDIKWAIINDLVDFTGPNNLYDDQTLLVIKFKPTQPKV
ncbi:serine phosphatase RsbU (regulator of sigma subunit) [Pontibacter ummariensis]|uniref:Serine phosphatase RsbU, regulator of sigma subunit n=1 Tax=Pontibacter ummariensis TaxID=1610492 RepID=A0A239B538_9BACT|nr:GAF domain-containing SpoIIE family protein phosphatase [Pontibacter ummariensis]PRY16275.1 serine phosphatase RsbU (regulator of sigma subunit) [Pontibacter ummariensis]SNS02333.1 Serine phosphatase RsbU, regulator of sigma subunit [Pontibacter ummariensis]